MSNSAIGFLSPKFEVNDIGIQSRSDVINAHSMLGYQWTEDGKYKRYANAWSALSGSWNFDGDMIAANLAAGGDANYRDVAAAAGVSITTVSDALNGKGTAPGRHPPPRPRGRRPAGLPPVGRGPHPPYRQVRPHRPDRDDVRG